MDDKLFAKQLKKPTGNIGKHVGNVMNDVNSFMNFFTFDCMKISNYDKILEVGFGNGKFIGNILEKANNIVYKGIELSEVMMDEAIVRNHSYIDAGIVELKLANVNNIPFDTEFFNKVVTINTVYFIEDMDRALNEICRVLVKGGCVTISIRSKEKFQNIEFSKYFNKIYDYNDLEMLLSKNGFENIRKEYIVEPNADEKLDVLCVIANKKH